MWAVSVHGEDRIDARTLDLLENAFSKRERVAALIDGEADWSAITTDRNGLVVSGDDDGGIVGLLDMPSSVRPGA